MDSLQAGISSHGSYDTELEIEQALIDKGFKRYFLSGKWAAEDGTRASILQLMPPF
mgnify:CR=1 FL=1